MSFKSKINQYRRTITKSLTKGLVNSEGFKIDKKQKPIKRILINRPNHRLGNMLMVTPLVQEIVNSFPDCEIDLFVKGKLASIIFSNYTQVKKIVELPKKPFKELGKYLKVWTDIRKQKYDLVIDVVQGSSSGRIVTKLAHSGNKSFGEELEELSHQYPDYQHMAKFPVYNFRKFMSLSGHPVQNTEIPVLDMKLSVQEIEKGKKVLDEITKDKNRETIAFFTYATGDKCFSVEWWDEFYEKFFPKYKENYNLIEILPVENISQLSNKLPSFYSKDIREIAALMNNCKLIVAGDSGMMHLSNASRCPTLGLFSVSSLPRYKPYGEFNDAIDTNTQTQDDIIVKIDSILERLKS